MFSLFEYRIFLLHSLLCAMSCVPFTSAFSKASPLTAGSVKSASADNGLTGSRRPRIYVIEGITTLRSNSSRKSIPSRLANKTSANISGRLCMTVELLRPLDELPGAFLECSSLTDQEQKEYQLKEKYLGIWVKRDCPEKFEFDPARQRCLDEQRKVHRQETECPAMQSDDPSAGRECPSECTATNANPKVGSMCAWQTAHLEEDPSSGSHFLQCVPQTSDRSCGEWTRMPCTDGTVFDRTAQLCVPSNRTRRSCPMSYVPVCQCGGTSLSCPGTSLCQEATCCMPVDLEIDVNFSPAMLQHQAPTCMGGGIPVALCGPACPQNYQCQQGIGCCPINDADGSSPEIVISIKLCPGSRAAPVGRCSSCPSGTSCNEALRACCPYPAGGYSTSLEAPYSSLTAACPDGSFAKQACGAYNFCPDSMGCYQGSCCPLVCPTGYSASGFCSRGSTCSTGNCFSGSCCQEQPRLPVCSNGQVSMVACISSQQCSTGMECSNGGCCPVPYCPSGVQATGRCLGNGCSSGTTCLEGLCCPLPRCPTGQLASRVCSVSRNCGAGMECYAGGCCPLPTCPTGAIPLQRCASGNSYCGSNQQCMNGVCCALPQCPTGVPASAFCSPGYQCGVGMECANGGCCSLPLCSSGQMPVQRCGINGCPSGTMCDNGLCCAMPTCSYTGQVAMSLCGQGNACPMGYFCDGKVAACCPEPLPLCPNGGRAIQRCVRGTECPAGYGCTALGGCCLLSLEPSCPYSYSPVCQCSSNNICPSGSSCNVGTCCTSAPATYSYVPGTQCQSNAQCNGFSTSGAQCLRNICVCINGAYSNGATCQVSNPGVLRTARSACDQYGSACKFLLSTARRKPLFSPIGNLTEEPLWYNVATERKCILNATDDLSTFDPDNTCLPNEKCINGKCRMKLWPGEYGCSADLECSSRCPNTYCETKSDKNVPQCQCRNGLLLYGRCFSKCPPGFHESGAYCEHDDEDTFWSNAKAQGALQTLLNNGLC